MIRRRLLLASAAGAAALLTAATARAQVPAGFTSLFNGRDFAGWVVPQGDNGHWKILDGAIDYDAQSEAPGDKNLWTERSYRDFAMRVDWRLKDTPYVNPRVPIIRPDGSHKLDAKGEEVRMSVPDSDSGIFVRGSQKSQINIWCWPVGSGEVYGYRMDKMLPPAVRAGVTPRVNADKNIGEWNTFEIMVRGERLTVVLNGQTVIQDAHLPGLPAEGRIGLQHHGGKRNGEWSGPPSLVQYRNLSIRELK